jgi:hypothetical protein
MEPNEPAESILQYFTANAGRTFTKRNINALNLLIPGYEFRLSCEYGMAQIRWGARSAGSSLLCAYTEHKTFAINPSTLREFNVGYLAGRVKRNEARRRLLTDERLLALAQADLQAWKDARAKLDAARARVDELWMNFDGPLHNERYTLEKLCDPPKER